MPLYLPLYKDILKQDKYEKNNVFTSRSSKLAIWFSELFKLGALRKLRLHDKNLKIKNSLSKVNKREIKNYFKWNE